MRGSVCFIFIAICCVALRTDAEDQPFNAPDSARDSVQREAGLPEGGAKEAAQAEIDATLSHAVFAPVNVPEITRIPPLKTRAYLPSLEYDTAKGIVFRNIDSVMYFSDKISATYDDNVLGTTKKFQKPDERLDYETGTEFKYKPNSDFTLDTSYQFGWHDYAGNNARDYLSHDAGLRLEWTNVVIPGLSFSLNEQYSQTGNTEVFQDNFFSFQRVQGDKVDTAIRYQARKLNLVVGNVVEWTSYFSRRDQVGDYNEDTLYAEASYKLADHLTPFVLYEFDSVFLTGSNNPGFDIHRVSAGAETSYKSLRFRGSVGVNAIEDSGTHVNPTARYDMLYNPSQRVLAYLSVSREFSDGVLTGVSRDTIVVAGMNYRLTSRLRLDAGIQYELNDRADRLHQDTTDSRIALNYRITKNVSGWILYQRADRHSNEVSDIAINRVQLGFRMQF